MASLQERQCTHLVLTSKPLPSVKEIRENLEKGSDEEKYEALRNVMLMHMNGDPQPKLLMTIIRFVVPSQYKPLKKLLLYYWEMIEKTQKDGKTLLPEMILVCSHIRNDLTNPNEYIRGVTLRFLCKVKETELLEPLIQPIIQNLEHRHSYVRRNAVLAIYSIYKTNENLIPDAPELVENFLKAETDISSKRNAFIMLFDCDQERAVKYLRSIIDQVSSTGDSFQLVLLNLLRKMCKTNPADKSKYLRVITNLLDSKSAAVTYQCAGTLVQVTSSPSAIKESAKNYIRLLLSHTDGNVKLICLERLVELTKKYPLVMQQVVMELMRILNQPDIEYKKKTLEIVMGLVSPRNVDTIIATLKKELTKSLESPDTEKTEGEYRKLIILALHQCAIKYPESANVALLALDFIGDTCGAEVILFVREIIEINPKLRQQILEKLCSSFSSIVSARVYRIALWILGDFCETPDQITLAFATIKQLLGELLLSEEAEPVQNGTEDKTAASSSTSQSKTVVRADGTYGTVQTAEPVKQVKQDVKVVNIKSLILDGNFYLGSVVASTLAKLGLRLTTLGEASANLICAESINIMCALIRLGTVAAEKPSHQMDTDTYERISLAVRLLSKPSEFVNEIFFKEQRQAFSVIVNEKLSKQKQDQEQEQKQLSNNTQPDALLNINQLRGKKFLDAMEFEDDEMILSNDKDNKKNNASRLSRVTQLTGFSDPVYAEATVTIHQFDILLDILVVNQTSDTLQNLTLELATVGDLKLCERPQTYTLAPFGVQKIKANIKVSSTETGIIFGNIIYDVSGAGGESNCVILNDVHIDIMDYIAPASCDEIQFRTMWFEFEWENKIPIAAANVTNMTLKDFLHFIGSSTNMNCLTPESALEGDCEFLSANMYAKSSFNEDALANVSLEKLPSGRIDGFVRIRSKTQGIALALGNIITGQLKKQTEAQAKQAKAQ